jgi:hypothetical protein
MKRQTIFLSNVFYRKQWTTMHNRYIFALIFAVSASITWADSDVNTSVDHPKEAHPSEPNSTPNVDIKLEPHFSLMPKNGLTQQRMFVEFKGSPKMTLQMQNDLRARGFNVVEKPEDADAKFTFNGIFSITGAGKEDVRGKLGDLFESAIENVEPQNPDYRHQNVNIRQIGVSAAYSGIASAISVTNIVRWISQQTGIAGRFNEMITGDPRGFCYGEQCTKFTTTVNLSVNGGDDGHWWVRGTAINEKMVLDLVIANALENAMKPFYDIKPPSSPSSASQ